MTPGGLSIPMPLRDWLFVDAEMDNTGQGAIDVYDEPVAMRAHAIREIGWNATGHITRPISATGVWPPGDDLLSEQVSVSLKAADWQFVIEHLLIRGGVAETVGHADEAAWARALAERIGKHLTAPRFDSR